MSSKSFEQLEIWQKGYELVLKVSELINEFPDFQKFGLTAQISKSSNSVIANIAEAHGRYYFLDKVRTLYVARGEISETRSHLKVAYGLSYIKQSEHEALDKEYELLQIGVNNYINYLLEQHSKQGNSQNSPN